MGIFGGLFRSRDKPENRMPGSSCAFYMGGSSSGKIVNERSAMWMTVVEMRAAFIQFTLPLFKLDNVQIIGSHAHIKGQLGEYRTYVRPFTA